MSFIKFNKDYFKSVEGVLKAALIITGAFCWGLVYIGAGKWNTLYKPFINQVCHSLYFNEMKRRISFVII